MSGDITMAQVVEALREVYLDDGVAMYLDSRISYLDNERAIDLCKTAEGRFRVWQRVQNLADGAW